MCEVKNEQLIYLLIKQRNNWHNERSEVTFRTHPAASRIEFKSDTGLAVIMFPPTACTHSSSSNKV